MLQAPARQQHARTALFLWSQGLDHGVVGVALFTLVVDDAFSREARRLLSEGAVLIDRVGDRGVDAARFQRPRIRGPDVEILAAMAGRGVNEAGASVVGDVVAFEKGDRKFVAVSKVREWMVTNHSGKFFRCYDSQFLVRCDARLL